jgi:repressor LexA
MTEPKYGDALPTKRQREIFDFIEAYQREHGFAPTKRQIAAHIGVHSLGSIDNHLYRMKKQGALRRSSKSNAFEINQQFSKGVYVKVVGA